MPKPTPETEARIAAALAGGPAYREPERTPAAVPVRLERDLYEALVKVAKKYRRSATAELNEIVLTWLQVSEEWALPEEK
jgi:hypothetical protein